METRVGGDLMQQWVHDAHGNLLETRSLTGELLLSQTVTSWGGLQTWTNGDGAGGSIDFDAAGQVVGIHAGDHDVSSVAVGGVITTSATYDAKGNVLERYGTDGTALGSYSYVDWGGLETWQGADGAVGSVEYDAFGQVVGLEANGQMSALGLDAFGRAVEVASPRCVAGATPGVPLGPG